MLVDPKSDCLKIKLAINPSIAMANILVATVSYNREFLI